jgi:hypothetical protein
MTFTFKLARRLALSRFPVLIGLALLNGSCAPGDPISGGLEPPPTDEPLSIHIVPDSVTVDTSASVDFQANGVMAGGVSVGGIPVTWEATGGTIATSGRYTAARIPGRWWVIGRHRNGKADTSIVIINPPPVTLVGVQVSPTSAAVVPGGSQAFSAQGVMSDGSTGSVAVTWTATGGTITSSGMLTAGSTPGSYQVIATQQGGSLSDTSAVTVTAPPVTLIAVELTPASVALEFTQTRQFSAVGRLSDGTTTAVATTWTATGGTVSASGLYRAGSTAGSFRVIAASANGLADTSAVAITAPTVTAISVTPATATLQSAATQQFTASATLSNGTTQSSPSVTWSATGGTISTAGLYTASGASGTFLVIAASANGVADTSAITITVPTITVITVTPPTASLNAGQTQQFTASATLSNGSTQNNPSVTWSSTGGTISTGGLYTAGNAAGSYQVIGRSANGVADTSAITITVLTVTVITVTPSTASLQTGQTQQFSASATLSNGTTQNNPAVIWSATGGTISTGGLYTAGNTPGSYQVIGRSANGVADTSAITITAPTVTAITVTPPTASLQIGQTQQFSASATLSNGTTQSNPNVTWTATGGTITSAGLYAAGNTAGSFRVIAVQQGGTLADTSAVTVTTSSARSFTTAFPLTESPLSEGGQWITGKAIGLDWSDVATASGRAFGTQSGTGGLDDAIAIVAGAWGPDQSATATVFSINPNNVATQEVELLLRFSITPHNAHGYEINFRAPDGGYIEVARWNGALSDFTALASIGGSLANGDVVKATAIGNVITVYKNGVQVLQVTDGTWATGSPGIGFFRRNNGAANTDFGFTSFTASN